MPDDDGRTFEIPFVNEPIFCDGKLDIEKLDVKGKPVVVQYSKYSILIRTDQTKRPYKDMVLKIR